MNHDFFKTWSHDMAYILGFIMADGSIRHKDYCKCSGNAISINLKLDDIEILKYIKNSINVKSNIYERKWTGSDNIYREQCMIVISSKILVEDIMKLGVVPQKTGKETFPLMPIEFEKDFIRGYFDGDGCIQNTIQKNKKYGIYPKYLFKLTCANEKFLDVCKSKMGGIGGKVRYHGKNCYTWQVQGKSDILEIRESFYNHNRFALDRKKQVFYTI